MLRQGHFICLEVTGEPTVQNIRSIHVYATDRRRAALLDKYRDQRVTVRFSSVAPPTQDYHRRSMIGAVESINPEP